MDAVLRARHDALSDEFVCSSTEFRIVRTPLGSLYSRTLDPYCNDARAGRFESLLTDYDTCCAGCAFLSPRTENAADTDPASDPTAGGSPAD